MVILQLPVQNICYPDLQAVVDHLAVFSASIVQVAPSIEVSQEAKHEALIEAYNEVRAGRITYPGTIRELAQRFFEIEDDPVTNKKFPYNAGEAARILLRRAKLNEGLARAAHFYDANAQANIPGRRRGNDNLMAGG